MYICSIYALERMRKKKIGMANREDRKEAEENGECGEAGEAGKRGGEHSPLTNYILKIGYSLRHSSA